MPFLFVYFRLYMRGPQCTAGEKMKDKVVVVTGANSGVGKEFALEMAKRGEEVETLDWLFMFVLNHQSCVFI